MSPGRAVTGVRRDVGSPPPTRHAEQCRCGGRCARCKSEARLRRHAGSEATAVPAVVSDVLRSSGEPVTPQARVTRADTFGQDFSRVPVHADGRKAAPPARSGAYGHDSGAIAGERKDGVVHGPASGANHWTDCPTTWQPKAKAAQTSGASWVDNAVNGLSALPTPIPAPVATLLQKHFHTTFDKDIAKILGRYKQIQTAIHSALNFECETSCDPNVLAYVYSIWTHLHLCPYWFNSAADLQASTVIHEIAHDIVGADDNAYEWQTAKYSGMSVSDAMNNADSFAHFAWDASKPPPTPPTPPPPPPPSPAPSGP
jgi:hypothetical protein